MTEKAPEKTLGELYATARKEAGISIEKAAEILKISKRVLQALEAGEYDKLPPDTFLRGIVRKYGNFLKLDSAEYIGLYEREKKKIISANAFSGPGDILPQNRFAVKLGLRMIGIKELAGVAVLVAFIYIIWQVGAFLQSPSLALDLPEHELMVTGASVLTVSGAVHGAERLTVNGEQILSGPDGRFALEVLLLEGENLIMISAENRRGRIVTLTRRVIYQPIKEVINN